MSKVKLMGDPEAFYFLPTPKRNKISGRYSINIVHKPAYVSKILATIWGDTPAKCIDNAYAITQLLIAAKPIK